MVYKHNNKKTFYLAFEVDRVCDIAKIRELPPGRAEILVAMRGVLILKNKAQFRVVVSVIQKRRILFSEQEVSLIAVETALCNPRNLRILPKAISEILRQCFHSSASCFALPSCEGISA
jgi:hypothetical protein